MLDTTLSIRYIKYLGLCSDKLKQMKMNANDAIRSFRFNNPKRTHLNKSYGERGKEN